MLYIKNNYLKMKKYTIIICTYNSAERINRIIDAILIQNDYANLVQELIVVDNNSTDTTKDNITKYGSKIKYIFEDIQGLSFARLRGVNATISEWIIFIDDDNLLKQNWIREADNFITQNPRIGAFNGAIIPLIEFDISHEEKSRLTACYGGLACTHLTEQNITRIKNFLPFGAGLVIRTNTLKSLAKKGWLNSTGRCGSQLISGEDTEMVLNAKRDGYDVGMCEKMIMYHQIPRFRLSEDYLVRLYASFAPTTFQITKQRHNLLYPIAFLKSILVNFYRMVISKFIVKNDSIYFSSKLGIMIGIKNLKKFFKNNQ